MTDFNLTQEQLDSIIGCILNGGTIAQASGISDDTLEAVYALAHQLYTSRNYKDALKVFRLLCLYNSQEYKFWMGSGGCYQALGSYSEAVDAYQFAAIACQMKNPEPILYACRCMVKLGRKEDALAGIEALLMMGSPDNPKHAECHRKASQLRDLIKCKE
ncbi:MAG: SycD/LcrH family type III secretion system chaperone [Duodenibacillus sp.]|nr:SycD/LcrH family type III secretion system chaperone [Duodenibacillus sp.]